MTLNKGASNPNSNIAIYIKMQIVCKAVRRPKAGGAGLSVALKTTKSQSQGSALQN